MCLSRPLVSGSSGGSSSSSGNTTTAQEDEEVWQTKYHLLEKELVEGE